jgi:tetratricopeptide (TPR) repeat protein
MKPLYALLAILALVGSLDLRAQVSSTGKRSESVPLDTLRAAVAKKPGDLSSWLALGNAFLKLGRTDSAVICGQRAVSIDKRSVEAYTLLSQAQLSKKDTVAALRTIRDGLSVMGNNQPLLTLLGLTYLAIDSTQQAIVAFSQANEAGPPSAEIMVGLGKAYVKRSAIPVAIGYYEKAVALDSLNIAYQEQLTALYLKNQQYNQAAKGFWATLKVDSTNHKALFELGRLYAAAKLWPNASQVWATYVRYYPDSSKAWAYERESFLNAKDYQRALAVAEKELKQNPGFSAARRAAGQSYFELGRYDDAVSSFQALMKSDTLTSADLRILGLSYARTGKDADAITNLEASLKADTTQRELYNELGVLYMRAHNYADAARMFERRFQVEPNATGAYINYALSMMQLNQFDQARAALVRAIELRPNYAPSHLALARCLVRMDSIAASSVYYKSFLELSESAPEKSKVDYAEAYSIIGLTAILDKRYPQAIENLQKSLKYRDESAQVTLWLGQAYALSGKRDEAIQTYKRVLKIDPNNKDAKKGLELLGEYLD